jgi:hypothetical protein
VSEQIRPDGLPPRGRADRLVVAGGVVFLLGLIALGVAMLISVKLGSAPGLVAAFTVLIPIGLAISFSGLVVQFRNRRRP